MSTLAWFSLLSNYDELEQEYGLLQVGWYHLRPLHSTNIPPLVWLDLSLTALSGEIPYSIGNLKSLKHLDLSRTQLSGEIPYSIGNLTSLEYLYLLGTQLSGEIPYSIGNLKSLKHLDLSRTQLSGEIPYSIGNLTSLEYLYLLSTQLSGEIPYSIGNLKSLKTLSLSFCGLVGSLPKSLVNLRQIITLDLESNMLNGTLPSSLFPLPFVKYINLSRNKFSGGLPSGLFNCPKLWSLLLGDNQFDGEINQGFIPPSFIQVFELHLSRNNFTGLWVLETLLSSMPDLEVLDLFYSGLSVMTNNATTYVNPGFTILGLASCKLTVFPESLRSMKYLSTLDLSRNNIEGSIPHWAGEIGRDSLQYLDLSHNSITSLPQFQWVNLVYLILESNLIGGPFPPSICNMSCLQLLDMSDNRFVGEIPRCVGNFSPELWKCDHPSSPPPEDEDDEDEEESGFTWKVVTLGFGCGTLLGLVMGYLMLSTEKPKWFNEIADSVEYMLTTRRNKRRFIYIGR
ncbi:hypothetical protein L2E82_31648 [Cichorium intybus]|uniref:Uncharacterized protein n=1 Tax=Cichorium intybus TaxID=13427 RepID=A0ACB9BF14_CICIN|nr:hypothetical protein L2E82_31648 [Cichorium intybus]